MELKDFILLISLAISIFTLLIVFKFRKKDFQITILKEQTVAYKSLIENLFETNVKINALYNEMMGKALEKSGDLIVDDLEEEQGLIFVKFGNDYNLSFKKFQSLVFLLPSDVIDATMEYFTYLHELFEENNDADLGVKLLTELEQKVFDVLNVIREHLAIDDITESTRELLSNSRQIKFLPKEEVEKLQREN